MSGPPTQPPITPLPPPEIDSDPTLRVIEEGLPAAAPDHSWLRRHSKAVSAGFAIVVFAALVVGLYSKRDAFIDALDAASLGVLAGATADAGDLADRPQRSLARVRRRGRRRLRPQAALSSRRRRLPRQPLNPSFGLAVRIAELRRTAPDHAPSAGVLVAAEMPIVVVEIALAGLCSFTLIGPLGIPWWLPLIALVVGIGVVAGLSGVANRKQHGLWQGLAVLRGLRHRNTIIALTVLAVSAQVFRNWLVLRGIGVDVSVFDSMALLIATAALGLLPVGPSLGVATTVLILGSKGVAQTAAAGALLTATGAVGAMIFASWALLDRWRTRS